MLPLQLCQLPAPPPCWAVSGRVCARVPLGACCLLCVVLMLGPSTRSPCAPAPLQGALAARRAGAAAPGAEGSCWSPGGAGGDSLVPREADTHLTDLLPLSHCSRALGCFWSVQEHLRSSLGSRVSPAVGHTARALCLPSTLLVTAYQAVGQGRPSPAPPRAMAGLSLASRAGLMCPLSSQPLVIWAGPVSFPAQGDCLCQLHASGLRHLRSSCPLCACTAALSQMCHHHMQPLLLLMPPRGQWGTCPQPFPLGGRSSTGPVH